MTRIVVYRNGKDASAGGRIVSYQEWPDADISPVEADMRALLAGTPGAMFDATQRQTLLTSTAPAVLVSAFGGLVARWLNLAADVNHANQTSESLRPLMRRRQNRVQGDGAVRIEVSFQPAIVAGEAWIDTPWGHFVSSVSASLYSLPVGGTRRAFIRTGALSAPQRELFARWAGSQRTYMVATKNGTTVNALACTEVNGGTQIRFVGANGVESTKLIPFSGSLTADLAVDGLTAPIAAIWPATLIGNSTMKAIRIPNCGFEGAIPNISGHQMLEFAEFNGNWFAGSIPSLASNPQLIGFSAASNDLSGRIPDLGANTALTTFDVSGNRLTDFSGTIPASVTSFIAANNLLTQDAVDAILLALVASGINDGYCNINGAANSQPSSAGLAAMAELVNRGWTVLVHAEDGER